MTNDAGQTEDGEEYEDEPEAAAPGLAVTALAGTVTGVAGFAVGGPLGAAIANATTQVVAVGFQWVVSAISGDKERRAERMLQSAEEAAGLAREQLADRAGESGETRFLTELRHDGERRWLRAAPGSSGTCSRGCWPAPATAP